jgi:HrpA-like RNA helicase
VLMRVCAWVVWVRDLTRHSHRAIQRLEELRRDPNMKEDVLLLPLHSALTSAEQSRIFKRPGPKQRKIIVATNIAETSITIDDVTHVIDSAKLKEVQYDGKGGITSLVEVWGSKASLRQRQGRAGRVQAGTCYKLITRRKFAALPDHHTPEILRVPLEQLCLRILAMERHNLSAFLSSFLDAPDIASVKTAVETLVQLNAVDKNERLTGKVFRSSCVVCWCRFTQPLHLGGLSLCSAGTAHVAAPDGRAHVQVPALWSDSGLPRPRPHHRCLSGKCAFTTLEWC